MSRRTLNIFCSIIAYKAILVLVKDLSDLTRTNGAATFADSEAETYVESNSVDEFYIDLYVITGHYHFDAFGEVDLTGAVHGAEIELRTILVTEGRMTATFFLLEDVDGSLEAGVGLDNTGVSDNHTTTNFVLVDTTKEQTYVITSLALLEELAEHFNASNNRLLVFTETENLNFVTNLYNTSLNTAGSNGTTTSDREDVFNRHKEGLIAVTLGLLDPRVASCHELHYLLFPLSNTIEGTESRTTDDRSIFLKVILREEILHIHFYELKHFFVVNHVALIEEYDEAGNVHLTSEEDVLTSLGHRTIGSSNYDDSTVHLSSTSNHVLNVVGVTRAVYVCIVTISSLILNVSSIDGDTTFLLFGSVIDLIERLNLRETCLSKYGGDSSGKSSFTVVNVTDSTNVHMGFGTYECFFCHCDVYI